MFIWDFVADTVLGQIVDWIYSQIVGFLGNIELSILSIVGRAESYKDISPYLEEMFYKFYPDIKKKISSKR